MKKIENGISFENFMDMIIQKIISKNNNFTINF